MNNRWIKLGALLGIIASSLLIFFVIYFTPDFVSMNLSPDGILEPKTINKINIIRMRAAIIGILILIFSIALIMPPHLSNYIFRNKLLILFAILLIGFFLRVYDLANESIWYDEADSILLANLNLSQIFLYPTNTPPLYYIILHWWINLFGDSEFSIRFPSVIFGCLSIFMIYKVGNKIFDKDVGILSSLLLGLSVFHIHYSQEARAYSLSVLLTLLSIFFLIKLLRRSSSKVLFGYILSSTLLIYSHIYGLFIIISQNIYIISVLLVSKETYKLKLKRWILIQIILIILFIPWINIFITRTLQIAQGFWIPTPSLSSIMNSFITYSGSELLFLFFVILTTFSIIRYEKISGIISRRKIFQSIESYRWKIQLLNTDKIFLLLIWLLTPIILPFIIAKFLTSIYLTRYTIVASLAFYLLIAKGILNIRQKYNKLIIISVIIVISSAYIPEYYIKINKEQWRDVSYYIDTEAKNGELVLFWQPISRAAFNYYSKRNDLIKKAIRPELKNKKSIKSAVEGYKRVWVISRPVEEKGDEVIRKKLIETYTLSYQRKHIGLKLYLFERSE